MPSTGFSLAAASSEDPADLNSIGDVWELLKNSMLDLVEGFISNLPIYLIALIVLAIGMLVIRIGLRAANRALDRSSLDLSLRKLTMTVARIGLLSAVFMVTLSIAGIEVGAALAALGLLGLAFVFAFQNILENFIAGLLILIRKPFRIGDQVIANGYEGTVADINMRVTDLTSYDGVTQLLPNADVFKNPLVNLTQLGKRRTSVMIGIDYRDDHHAAGEIIRAAVAGVEGVLDDPPVEVLLTALGDSSVDFEIRYWTAPEIKAVRHTQDGVLRAAKSAVEDSGMSIPWPIRTLEPGAALKIVTHQEA